jgi:hypothetical protein
MAQFVGHVNPGVEAGDAIRQAIAMQEAKRMASEALARQLAQQGLENQLKVGEFGLKRAEFGEKVHEFDANAPGREADVKLKGATAGKTVQDTQFEADDRSRKLSFLNQVPTQPSTSQLSPRTLVGLKMFGGPDLTTQGGQQTVYDPKTLGGLKGAEAKGEFEGGGSDVLQTTQDIIGKRQKDVAAARPGGYGSTPYFTVNTDGDLVAVNRRDLTQTVLPDVNPATAQQRDATVGRNRATPVIKSISDLSEKINTGQGVLAKITGGAERLAAKANLDDDVAEYQAIISGFTPLVARALGHVGVLTQQDVDSVREIFPKPGDSKSLRDRKVTRLITLMGEIKAAGKGDDEPATTAPAQGAVPPAAAKPKVTVRELP